MKASIPLVIWIVVIAFASLMSVTEASSYRFFNNEDKVAHIVMYLVLAFLLQRAIGIKSLKVFSMVFVVASLFGYTMEILQEVLDTGRLFDYFDIIANIFGAFVGTMLFYMPNRSKEGILNS